MKRGRDNSLITVFGGHANVGNLIKESEILQFLDATTPKIIDGFYNKTVAIKTPFGKFHSYKTYFPNDWTLEEIILTTLNKLKEAIYTVKENGKLEFVVSIHEKIELKYFFNLKTKTFDTIFPILKE